MIQVEEMGNDQIIELVRRVGYAHLGCSVKNIPYIVPIHYAYDDSYFYVYTTEGKKSEMIATNPQVCLQIEDVADNRHWKSVIVTGEAERLLDEDERQKALKSILETNPTLTPAVSIRWMDNWVRENIEVIYRIKPDSITGRASVE